ncbi:MAG: hypothetical protein GC168_20525 [Candidatus Hydrogenedens sp.]|nr:hypothetical protein [Candidatus Hydrogenedens sp.]
MTPPRAIGRPLLATPAYAPDFQAFWAAVPHRPDDRKAPAHDAYRRLVRFQAASAGTLLAAATAYARSREGKSNEFIVSTERWLADGDWRDWADAAETAAETAASAPPAVRAESADPALERWLQGCVVSDRDGTVTIKAPSRFRADRLRGEQFQALTRRWPGRRIEVL